VSIGNVGTGFTDKSLNELHTKLKALTRKTSPLDVSIKETPDITWVDPVLVCNIKFTEITDEGSVRHPVFQGLRIDKSSGEVELERPQKILKVKRKS
jgi:bifunctional non-homologous end joining protein LigD